MVISRLTNLFERRSVQSIVGILLSLVAIVSLIYSWRASTALTDYAECQQRWNAFFYLAISTNREANDEATQALDQLVITVSTARSREETAAALQRYKDARTKQLQARVDHPLPAPPDEVCKR